MGFSRGNEVFDPVAKLVIEYYGLGYIPNLLAENLLTTLIDGLQNIDWDTENESLEEFKDEPIVVTAFHRCDIELASTE